MRGFPTRTIHVVTAILAVTASTACASAARAPSVSAPPARDSIAELEALYRARVDSSRTRFTEADVRFMSGMIGHHAQALIMSRMAPTHGASEAIQTLAARIINAQEDEIATMQQWLRDRGQPVPEIHIAGNTLMVHGAEHAMHMPGMLTDAQLRQLDAARGAEFDRLFLAYMIHHHEGAVTMVRKLFRTDGAAQDEDAYRIAADINADQTAEIDRMQLMLSALRSDGANR